MIHPFDDDLLKEFPQLLEQCTREEWEKTLKELIYVLLVEVTRNNQMSGDNKQWLDRLITALRCGPKPPKIGRRRNDEQALCDATLFELLGVRTIADGVAALKRGPKYKHILRLMLPWLSVGSSLDQYYPDSLAQSDATKSKTKAAQDNDALRKRVTNAATRAGYQFSRGSPFGK